LVTRELRWFEAVPMNFSLAFAERAIEDTVLVAEPFMISRHETKEARLLREIVTGPRNVSLPDRLLDREESLLDAVPRKDSCPDSEVVREETVDERAPLKTSLAEMVDVIEETVVERDPLKVSLAEPMGSKDRKTAFDPRMISCPDSVVARRLRAFVATPMNLS
jgi:hypothetical protein